jgi:nucleotide-binding universal stress UspA family protein
MSVFPMTIVVATDGSAEANVAVQTAAELVAKSGSELHIVHVRVLPFYLSSHAISHASKDLKKDLERERKQLEKMAQELLDEQARIIEDAGGSVAQAHLRFGKPDEEVTALAEEISAGLIVMGSRGLGGTRRALMGSGSDSVVRHAHCSVLIVRKED